MQHGWVGDNLRVKVSAIEDAAPGVYATMSGFNAASPKSNASSLATWFIALLPPLRLMTKVSAARKFHLA